MKFADGRQIARIQVPITRVCNRRCPDCCARERLTWYNKTITEKEVSLQELEEVGKRIGKIARIEITGGEPTLHSKFEELTNTLTELFQCTNFMLVTNGWLFGKDQSKLPLLMKYQRVWLSHYTEEFTSRYGGETNTTEVMIIEKFLKENKHPDFTVVIENKHTSFGCVPYGGKPCQHYLSDMVSYYEGCLYGCCVAWSLPHQGVGIPLTTEWRKELNRIELPCEFCFLSGSAS